MPTRQVKGVCFALSKDSTALGFCCQVKANVLALRIPETYVVCVRLGCARKYQHPRDILLLPNSWVWTDLDYQTDRTHFCKHFCFLPCTGIRRWEGETLARRKPWRLSRSSMLFPKFPKVTKRLPLQVEEVRSETFLHPPCWLCLWVCLVFRIIQCSAINWLHYFLVHFNWWNCRFLLQFRSWCLFSLWYWSCQKCVTILTQTSSLTTRWTK